MWMRDVITIAEPKLFIAENVKGLASLGDARQVIERDFSSAGGGYLVVPARVLYAPDYGVPQSRERIIFFGFKKPALNRKALEELSKAVIDAPYDPYPPRTHGAGLMPYVTCADALAGLAEPEDSGDPDQKRYSRCRRTVGQGQSEVKLDSVGPTIRAEHHGNIEFRRLSEGHGGRHTHELAAGLPERRLTVRECARLQTFPDDYSFACVSASEAYRLIGNAVPPLLAYAIARNVEAKWDVWFGE
jgi:DNA (cytosine-5)-methyltransferase 1